MLPRIPALLAGLMLVEVANAEPFLTRDQNILLSGLGLPSALPVQLASADSFRLGLTINWSNTANSELTANEALLIDLETRELRLVIERSLTGRISLRLQVPYRHQSAGVLDSFIDSWHETLGLPEGARSILPNDRFSIAYQRNARRVLELREPSRGIGDVSLEAGYQWWQSAGSAGAVWLSMEAPTGSSRHLHGNGAWDFSLAQSGMKRISDRWTVYWQGSVTHAGEGRYLQDIQKEWIIGAVGTLAYALTPSVAVKAQVDAHTASYESRFDFLGPATILTLGGDYRFAGGWQFDFGISEDIVVSAAPDVSFHFALRRSL